MQSSLACKVFVQIFLITLWELPCIFFSLVAVNNLSLSLVFVSLITVHLGMFLLVFILAGTLCFLDLVDYPMLGTFQL